MERESERKVRLFVVSSADFCLDAFSDGELLRSLRFGLVFSSSSSSSSKTHRAPCFTSWYSHYVNTDR